MTKLSPMTQNYANYLKNYNQPETPATFPCNTRTIGLEAFAHHEEDKRVRSGLVRFYDSLTTVAVRNAVLDAIQRQDRIALQAAIETLLQRGDDGLVLQLLLENSGKLVGQDAMTAALSVTFMRHDNPKRSTMQLILRSLGECDLNNIEFLDKLVSRLLPAEIINLRQKTLNIIVELYQTFGEQNPQRRIQTLLENQLMVIARKKDTSIHSMNPDVCKFLGIRLKTDF